MKTIPTALVSINSGALRLSPELTRALEELNKQTAEVMQPVLQLAAEVAASLQPLHGTLEQIAQAMRPQLVSGWLEAIERGTQQLDEAMQNAETMGRSGWTFPMNADLGECVRLLNAGTTAQSADAAFMEFYLKDDHSSLILLLEDLQQQPKLEDFRGLLEEIAFGLQKEKNRLVVTALLPLLEGVARRCWEDGVWTRDSRNAFFDRKIGAFEVGSFDHIVWTATRAFVDGLYKRNWSGDPKPPTLNRHWILHGRGPADGNLADCLRLLQAIHTIVSLAEDEQAERDQPMSEEAIPRLKPGVIVTLVEKYLAGFRELRGKPVEYVGGGTEPDGTIHLAQPVTAASVYAFVEECQKKKIIYPFDWTRFVQRAEGLVAPGGIEAASLEELRRLLTVIIRQDRFGGGVVEEMAENGVFARVLERMAALTDEASGTK